MSREKEGKRRRKENRSMAHADVARTGLDGGARYDERRRQAQAGQKQIHDEMVLKKKQETVRLHMASRNTDRRDRFSA